MKASVNMVVRNEAMFIRYAMRSAFPIAGEFIIIDNGSSDNTVEQIEQLAESTRIPITVHSMPTCDDLAFMWNACLYNSQYEWAVILAGDEVFYNEGENDIQQLAKEIQLQGGSSNFDTVFMPFHHVYGQWDYVLAEQVHPGAKFVRNNGKVRWKYPHKGCRVHEAPVGARATVMAKRHFVHYGYMKSGKQLWEKGKQYQERGWENSLWHQPAEQVLKGNQVMPIPAPHPSIMQTFPMGEYRTEIVEKEGNFYIGDRSW